MNQNTQFMNKLNQGNHFINQQQQQQQQQQLANRFIGLTNLNSNQFLNNVNNGASNSPPLNAQIKSQLQSFSGNGLSLGQQQQQQIQQSQQTESFNQMQRNNYQIAAAAAATNLMYPVNQLNFANMNTQQQQNLQQQLNAPSLIASVVAANSTCSLNNTLFVGNLHASLQEIDLVQVFRPFGRIVECCKKWLHFGFVKFTSEEEACHAYVTLNGFRLKGRPMRLEFQNRTKKARIKAILAQAALQASSNGLNCNNEAIELANMGFSAFLSEDTRQVMSSLQAANQINTASHFKNIDINLAANDCSLFDSDQLIKFANSIDSCEGDASAKFMSAFYAESHELKEKTDLSFNDKCLVDGKENEIVVEVSTQLTEDQLGNALKKHISPSESPHYEFSCSLSSSDSGCRSTASFLAEEDSGIASLQTTKSSFIASSLTISKVKHDSCLTEENLESFNVESSQNQCKPLALIKKCIEQHTENMSVTDLDDCEDSDSDTSDDASDIPDSECLDDLASLGDLDDLYPCGGSVEAQELNQVIEKDGSILRKKLEFGIYRSINQTLSLFIEPQDILKKIDCDEYNEYLLFPNGVDNIDSYFALVM